jgi:uncharacterized protein (DUF1501 family)
MKNNPNLIKHLGIDPVREGRLPHLSRRQLLTALGLSSAAVVAGCTTTDQADRKRTDGSVPDGASAGTTDIGAGDKGQPKSGGAARTGVNTNGRVLVVVELLGGIDGFATLVPYGDGRFRKLRERIWVDQKELSIIDDRYGVTKGLGRIQDKLAFVEGVGVAKPDLSHFDMMRRWWSGDPDGKAGVTTGFLGRCCDRIANGEPITGVSIGGGSTPALISETSSAVSVPAIDLMRELSKSEAEEKRTRAALRFGADERNGIATGVNEEADRLSLIARENMASGLDLLANFSRLGERDKRYPEGNELALSLNTVRQLISLDVGMQVFHVPWGSFDTHTDQVGNHATQMDQFGLAIEAFLSDLNDAGLTDRVLLATTSEFGRRAEANGNGTDHGTASTMMLAGAVKSGRFGESPDFARMDSDGNVKAKLNMNDYYATLASWLGITDPDVLVGGGSIIDGLLAA